MNPNPSKRKQKQQKFDANQLISYSTLKSIQQIGQYYNRNKTKLPPILQSRRIFVQQIQANPSDRVYRTIETQEVQRSKQTSLKNSLQKTKFQTIRDQQNNFQSGLVQIKPKKGLIIFENAINKKIKRQSLISYCLTTKNRSHLLQNNNTNTNNNSQENIIQKTVNEHLSKRGGGQTAKNVIKQNTNSILSILQKMPINDKIQKIKRKAFSKRQYIPSSLIIKEDQQHQKSNNFIKEAKISSHRPNNHVKIVKSKQKTQIAEVIPEYRQIIPSKIKYIKTAQCQVQPTNNITVNNIHKQWEYIPKEQPAKVDKKKLKIKIPSIGLLQPWNQEEKSPAFDYSTYIRDQK